MRRWLDRTHLQRHFVCTLFSLFVSLLLTECTCGLQLRGRMPEWWNLYYERLWRLGLCLRTWILRCNVQRTYGLLFRLLFSRIVCSWVFDFCHRLGLCSGTTNYTTRQGRVWSHWGGGVYMPNMLCTFNIQPTIIEPHVRNHFFFSFSFFFFLSFSFLFLGCKETILLEFELVNLEYGLDLIYLYDGDKFAGTITGFIQYPRKILSFNGRLQLVFQTNYAIENLGFNAKYTTSKISISPSLSLLFQRF